MITATLVFLVVLTLIGFSIRERIRLRLQVWPRHRSQKLWEVEPRFTPFSEAIVSLIGMAGGIYLSLILILTFLDLNVPERMRLGGIEMDVLAAFSIAVAVLQPFVIRLWSGIRGRLGS
ncbi:MAG: hypothetical protein IBX71_06655 [Candidatus Desulforudis sp.]|nr:hypothetical protein [Desulforudis sp.]